MDHRESLFQSRPQGVRVGIGAEHNKARRYSSAIGLNDPAVRYMCQLLCSNTDRYTGPGGHCGAGQTAHIPHRIDRPCALVQKAAMESGAADFCCCLFAG